MRPLSHDPDYLFSVCRQVILIHSDFKSFFGRMQVIESEYGIGGM